MGGACTYSLSPTSERGGVTAHGAPMPTHDDTPATDGWAPTERVPASILVAYGLPSFAGSAMLVPVLIHMPTFYADVVLVPLGYLALAIAVARAR